MVIAVERDQEDVGESRMDGLKEIPQQIKSISSNKGKEQKLFVLIKKQYLSKW